MKSDESNKGLVKKMREIRDKLSSEIMDMTFEQEKLFIQEQLRILKYQKHITPNQPDVKSV